MFENTIAGNRLTIAFLSGAEASYDEVMKKIALKQREGIVAKLDGRFAALSSRAKLRSPDFFNKECTLPNGKNAYAVKVGKIRVYGWYSDKYKGFFIVSHFAYKTTQKLAKKDKSKIIANWNDFER